MNGNSVYMLLTVDWEADHAIWHDASPDEEDYGGALVGTHGLMTILDEFGIPCTWLVECHAEHPDRDLPNLFPEMIRLLYQRPQDEIGAHVHWIRRQNGQDIVSVEDSPWVDRQVRHASQMLLSITGVAPVSFRGGAFLPVPRLPGILEGHGYQNDATFIEPGHLRRLLTRPLQPYRCDASSASVAGSSRLVEFPTHFRITAPFSQTFIDRLLTFHARSLIKRFHTSFLNLYLHIDELTLPGSGRDQLARLDTRLMMALRRTVRRLLDIEGLTFITMRHARQLLQKTLQPVETL